MFLLLRFWRFRNKGNKKTRPKKRGNFPQPPKKVLLWQLTMRQTANWGLATGTLGLETGKKPKASSKTKGLESHRN
jgi:hypothetical protein